MKRRDFVKAMVAASVAAKAALAQQAPAAGPGTAATPAPIAAPQRAPLAPGPVPWSEGLLEVGPLPIAPVVPDAVAQTQAHFFSERQMATLSRLAEVLMPPLNGYPGALEAGTPEFLDFLIGESPAERQQTYRAGLDRLEAEARVRFGAAFAEIGAAQADKIIRPWLRTWMPDHLPTEGFAHFVNLAHSDVRQATINSQLWNEAEMAAGRLGASPDMYWYPVDPDMRRQAREAVTNGQASKRTAG
jgi:hypothetical protein